MAAAAFTKQVQHELGTDGTPSGSNASTLASTANNVSSLPSNVMTTTTTVTTSKFQFNNKEHVEPTWMQGKLPASLLMSMSMLKNGSIHMKTPEPGSHPGMLGHHPSHLPYLGLGGTGNNNGNMGLIDPTNKINRIGGTVSEDANLDTQLATLRKEMVSFVTALLYPEVRVSFYKFF